MLICLHGSDSYRRIQKTQDVFNAYKIKHPQADVFAADFSEDPDAWKEVKDFLQQPSMFAPVKIALVREGASISEKDWVATLKHYLEDPQVFVVLSDTKTPPKKFAFLLSKPVTAQSFPELSGAPLVTFLKQELDRHNLRLSQDAIRFFLRYITNQQDRSWRAVRILEQLALARFKRPVSEDHLQEILRWTEEGELFQATRSFLHARSIADRLVRLEQLFLRSEDPTHLFNLIAHQAFRSDALLLADYDIMKKSGKLEDKEALLGFALR